tara:strand:+ start:9790 stop:10773 length:984 start_codon:yes stop_codon:yes gene_type:complete
LEIKRNINPKEICNKIIEGNISALSKAITLCESNNDSDRELSNQILANLRPKNKNTIRIGITGVPGAGKSTFIEAFGNYLSDLGFNLAVLTIDPSSKATKGSILGDKTRMETLSAKKNVFIRPSPASNYKGGVGKNTPESIFLCESAGYEVILVETVGVGQNEINVSDMVDFFLLLKITGSGDELQGIKRGIIEMSDLIVINKCDGNNIEESIKAKNEFKLALQLFPIKNSNWKPKVVTCSSIEKEGLENIWDCINEYVLQTKKNNYFFENRINQNKTNLLKIINESLRISFFNKKSIDINLDKLFREIEDQKITVFEASKKILSQI